MEKMMFDVAKRFITLFPVMHIFKIPGGRFHTPLDLSLLSL